MLFRSVSQSRYGGEKLDISKGDESYYKVLEHYRRMNKRLGYGDDSEEWSIKLYRKARARLKRRIKGKLK